MYQSERVVLAWSFFPPTETDYGSLIKRFRARIRQELVLHRPRLVFDFIPGIVFLGQEVNQAKGSRFAMPELSFNAREMGICVCELIRGILARREKKSHAYMIVVIFVSGFFIHSKVVRKSYVTRGPKNSGKALNAVARDIATFFLENNYRIAKAGMAFLLFSFFPP